MNTQLDRRDFTKVCSTSTLSVLTCGLSDALTAAAAEAPSAKPIYDCIVLGLGAMGSACVYQLAKRGASVLGLERFDIAHELGSSGGISRQTKVMPYLGGRYEPLIRRANENWRALEQDSNQQVFHQCGYLQLGVNQRLPRREGMKIELLDESALAKRFPQFQRLPKGTNGILDHQGGLLRSELAIASHCHVALRHGAHIHAQEPVTDWSTDDDGVTVATNRGSYRAKHLVVAAGAWNAKLVPKLRDKLQVTRLSLGWFAPKDPASFSVKNFPIWLHGAHYGFPVLPDFPGFKAAKHWGGDPTDPEKVDRVPNASDEKLVRDYLGAHLPAANGSVLAFKVCMYTLAGPWLGPLPGEQRVTFSSGQSVWTVRKLLCRRNVRFVLSIHRRATLRSLCATNRNPVVSGRGQMHFSSKVGLFILILISTSQVGAQVEIIELLDPVTLPLEQGWLVMESETEGIDVSTDGKFITSDVEPTAVSCTVVSSTRPRFRRTRLCDPLLPESQRCCRAA